MIKKIACCVDFSENAKAAFGQALELAGRFQSKLYIVHVLPPVFNPVLPDNEYVFPEQPKDALIIKVEERIQQEYASLVREGIENEIVVLDGHISSEIIRFLGDEEFDYYWSIRICCPHNNSSVTCKVYAHRDLNCLGSLRIS